MIRRFLIFRLYSVALKLSSLPFVLNSFTSYGFQIFESLKTLVSTSNLEFGRQYDGISGVCLSGILALDNFKQDESGFEIILNKRLEKANDGSEEEAHRIQSKKGTFTFWKSRFLEYTVVSHSQKSKQFFIQFWINGPQDTKSNKF